MLRCCLPLVLTSLAVAAPKGSLPLESTELARDYRLHIALSEKSAGVVHLGERVKLPFEAGKTHDFAIEHPAGEAPTLRIWQDGKQLGRSKAMKELDFALGQKVNADPVKANADHAIAFVFEEHDDGPLVAWESGDGDALAVEVHEGELRCMVKGKELLRSEFNIADGKAHRVLWVVKGGKLSLWMDGAQVGETTAVLLEPNATLRVGSLKEREEKVAHISKLLGWQRFLADAELAQWFQGDGAGINTPDLTWRAVDEFRPIRIELECDKAKVTDSWLQGLELVDHARTVRNWGPREIKRGHQVYQTSCKVCHGNLELPGSLPTARRFGIDELKNGTDPLSMWQTLEHGFGAMPPQLQFDTRQKYAVIYYIREQFLKERQPKAYTELTDEYLATLPLRREKGGGERPKPKEPPYLKMDFGPAMHYTYRVHKDNIAHKGIAIRLDPGKGGVSKGRAWMFYDHDTLRLATATTGEFINWRDIAFDGSHGRHIQITGEQHIVNPEAPGWASPEGSWEDVRFKGTDGRRYGPLPRDWARYRGMRLHGDRVVLEMEINGTKVLESPKLIEVEDRPIFVRELRVGEGQSELRMRVAPVDVAVVLRGEGRMEQQQGHWVAVISAAESPQTLELWMSSKVEPQELKALSEKDDRASDLAWVLMDRDGPAQRRWGAEVTTESTAGSQLGAFVVDGFPLPDDNPWNSWMRPGGFDFMPDGKTAILATWNGDVWRIEGVTESAPAQLRWQRIATGLFQPLGLKVRDGEVFVGCRDQIVKLVDLNGDREADFYECFNNDHQVTEHFHEFAMALQTDKEGNFYYAKSARHARRAVVPHHGTVIKVSADGSKSEILANGLRAANGLCINLDGTFFVTDQEGQWTPKNRINRIEKGHFYGNMLGYHDVKSEADDAMEQPMVWVDDSIDRSPGELAWVPENAWSNLSGSLLSLSYGTGKIYVVPHEKVGNQWQGAVCEFPMPGFPTGIMRGRFHPEGDLYICGMHSWAGNATEPGGFYRVRPSGKPAHVPLGVYAGKRRLDVTFSDPLDPSSTEPKRMAFKTWAIKRGRQYGSERYDSRKLEVSSAKLSGDGRTLTIGISDLKPTHCYELSLDLVGVDGQPVRRTLQGTIHQLASDK